MIRFLIMDVDGTLTDGKIYMGENGELFKAFDIKDGCGIKEILPKYNIIPVVITARRSRILENRCCELDITELHQGGRNKIEILNKVLEKYSNIEKAHYTLANCAYIGDDLLDIQCMKPIREMGGITGCPNDAVDKVKEISDFVSHFNGGDGAVREFIGWITSS
jgi:3-deoxy-D-manno-octulosonate 8-phosphate phosphatase (KDO 8-P phosphatase)